nr:Cellulose synthase-like protein D2 [Ipomoea batatas]
MEDDPEREENFAEQWAPGLVAAVEGVGEAGDDSNESSPNSVSSAALAVTVKLVSIPAIILRIPWNTAKRWAETPPMTQNCSLRHQSSMLTPLHRNSRMLVTMMAINSPRNRALARQRAVCNEGNGGERVDNGVDICEPLKPFKAAAAKSIPERTMSAEENLDRS